MKKRNVIAIGLIAALIQAGSMVAMEEGVKPGWRTRAKQKVSQAKEWTMGKTKKQREWLEKKWDTSYDKLKEVFNDMKDMRHCVGTQEGCSKEKWNEFGKHVKAAAPELATLGAIAGGAVAVGTVGAVATGALGKGVYDVMTRAKFDRALKQENLELSMDAKNALFNEIKSGKDRLQIYRDFIERDDISKDFETRNAIASILGIHSED